jgi:RimJ/RimL family protein N-acetyltransferase
VVDYWQGRQIRLRGVEPDDAEFFHTWNRDSDMARYVDRVWFPASREHQRRWAVRTSLQEPDADEFLWAIEDSSGQLVGSINTHHCDRRTGTFEYGVAVRSEHQRKGYASEAITLVLRYLFDELRYQKVSVRIHSENLPSIRLHERLGFQLEGRLRRMAYGQGRYADELVFGLTIEEFHALQEAGSLPFGPVP